MHNKIKRLLTRRAGIPASAIAIITGKQNNTPDEIMAVQDGFNADGADNKYRIVIANEKAEVGINLQRGTQAIHHLTIGWTPDSLTQRNGRGVRQGNKTERVTVYTYDADGTFDSHKRAMVSKKSGWIDQVMDVNGGDSINVEGGMSREQLEALIDTVGDADAMTRLQERLAAKEREVRAVGVRAKQTVNIRTVQASRRFLAENPDVKTWAARKFGQYYTLKQQAQVVAIRLANPKASAGALVKGQNLLADLNARLTGLKTALDETLVISKNEMPASIDDLLTSVTNGYIKKGEDVAEKVINSVLNAPWGFVVKANDNSALANDWQAEVDMTKAMIKEAKSAFTKHSKLDGGLPKDVMDAISDGKGLLYDGKPVIDGAFVKTEAGQLGVVVSAGLEVRAWREDGKTGLTRLSNLRLPFEIILPGSTEYDAAITQAAEIDDAIAAAGIGVAEAVIDTTFSALVPAVSQRRTTATLITCDADTTGLPAPYFPMVVDPARARTGAVLAAIVASQAGVLKSYVASEYRGARFTVEVTCPVIQITSGRAYGVGFGIEGLAYARANSMKITLPELWALGVSERMPKEFARSTVSVAFESVLTGSTIDELNTAAKAWIVGRMPDIDFDDFDPLDELVWTEKAALQAAIKRAMAPPQVPVAEVVVSLAPAAGEPESIPPGAASQTGLIGQGDLVGIKGNTKEWKDRIKVAAAATGGRAIWDGNSGQWNVAYKAWMHLTQTNPRCLQPGQLEMVEFSGKASYGKRR